MLKGTRHQRQYHIQPVAALSTNVPAIQQEEAPNSLNYFVLLQEQQRHEAEEQRARLAEEDHEMTQPSPHQTVEDEHDPLPTLSQHHSTPWQDTAQLHAQRSSLDQQRPDPTPGAHDFKVDSLTLYPLSGQPTPKRLCVRRSQMQGQGAIWSAGYIRHHSGRLEKRTTIYLDRQTQQLTPYRRQRGAAPTRLRLDGSQQRVQQMLQILRS